MNREQYINYLKAEIYKYKKKCKKSKVEFIKTYYLGQLYRNQETLRRLTGKTIKITDAYWFY